MGGISNLGSTKLLGDSALAYGSEQAGRNIDKSFQSSKFKVKDISELDT